MKPKYMRNTIIALAGQKEERAVKVSKCYAPLAYKQAEIQKERDIPIGLTWERQHMLPARGIALVGAEWSTTPKNNH